jgi:tetratricopeptide (TPR) repeat protein
VAVWAALAASVAVLVWAARRVAGSSLWLAIAAATYGPVSGLVPVYPAIADRALFMPEHFLYLPLLGLAPLAAGAAAGLVQPNRARKAAPLALGIVLIAWGSVVIDRNRDWRDEETIFRHTLRHNPPAARVWFNMGNLELAAGNLEEASRLFLAALDREPGDPAAHLNLGITFQRLGRLADAEAEYRRVIALDPRRSEAYRGLAALLAKRGERVAARALWEEADRIDH